MHLCVFFFPSNGQIIGLLFIALSILSFKRTKNQQLKQSFLSLKFSHSIKLSFYYKMLRFRSNKQSHFSLTWRWSWVYKDFDYSTQKASLQGQCPESLQMVLEPCPELSHVWVMFDYQSAAEGAVGSCVVKKSFLGSSCKRRVVVQTQ